MKKRAVKKRKRALSAVFSVLVMIFAILLVTFTVFYILKGHYTETAPEASPDESKEEPSLSSLFVSSDEGDDLYVYTGEALSGLYYPELLLCGDELLLYDCDYSESEASYMTFCLVDLESGSLMASSSLECEFLTDIRLTDKGIMYADSSLGYAALLGEDLAISEKWVFEANYEYWYISEDGEGIYIIDDGFLVYTDLESGNETEIISDSVSLYGMEALNGGCNISYVNEDEMSLDVWLDLNDGSLTEPSVKEAVSSVSAGGSTWLFSLEDTGKNDYILGNADEFFYILLEDGTLSVLENSSYILYEDNEGGFALYDPSGSFISSCSFSEDDYWFNTGCSVYSETYGGVFILANTDDGPLLFFWDLSVQNEGTGLDTIALSEYEQTPGGSSAESSLYERAAALSEEYGIEILIADQCESEYDDFTAALCSDTELIENGLDILEKALSSYPDGFIEQLKYNKINGIQINLTGTLTPTNDNWGEESYNGLTQEHTGKSVMVLDLNQIYEDTVYHEFSHIIDSKLEWDSYCREDALFSEEAWNSLNPEGFEYVYEYSGFTELEFSGDEYLYFIDVYSMVSPTEDRARIMEYAMSGYDSYFIGFEPTMAKLSYYAECIRDCFDTSSWPEVTAWEEVLR